MSGESPSISDGTVQHYSAHQATSLKRRHHPDPIGLAALIFLWARLSR